MSCHYGWTKSPGQKGSTRRGRSQSLAVTPVVPYTGALAAPLSCGHMIILTGDVKPRAQKVDLLCGLAATCDIALHVNPRFDEMRLVRNTRVNGRWGKEESEAPRVLPLRPGMPFSMYIFVAENQFLVAVDGRHICAFPFRLPLARVAGMHITGDITLCNLEHQQAVTEYPMSSGALASITPPVPLRPRQGNLGHIAQSNAMDMPFEGHIPPGRLVTGRQIELIGHVKFQPDRFSVNFQKGKTTWPQPLIVFHFNPRFREGVIVRNSYLNGAWGAEERGGGCPLQPSQRFHLVIRCEAHHFTIALNGLAFATFMYRQPITEINTILVHGDVQVFDVCVR